MFLRVPIKYLGTDLATPVFIAPTVDERALKMIFLA